MKRVSIIVSIAALLLPFGALADEHEAEQPGPLSDVWIVVPKKGMESEFAAAVTKHMAFRAEAGESRAWLGFRVVMGENISKIGFRSCCFNYADLDAFPEEDREKGLGANWNENVDQYVDHYHHHLETMDWENSHWPDGKVNGPYYSVSSWEIKLGAGQAWNEARKKLSRLALDEGWASDANNWLWHTRVTGKAMQMMVSSAESFADMAPPETPFFAFVSEKVGAEEAAAIFEAFNSGFKNIDHTIWVYDADLSTPSDDE